METINISLPDALRTYVEKRVIQDGYDTTSEYFRELVQQDQRRQADERLEASLLKSLDGEPAKPFAKSDIEEVRQAVSTRLSEKRKV